MNIVVVGSLNMDVVIPLKQYPGPGETVTGGYVTYVPGGKGANQALAAARLGGQVTHLGVLGSDSHGETLRKMLQRDGVNTSYIQTWEGPTGMAFVHVERDGQNRIILSPGANHHFSPKIAEQMKSVIEQADAIMVQLEIPMETVQFVLDTARKAGVQTFLDPAPARADLFDYISEVDWITPNESEAQALTGQMVTDSKTARIAAAKLQQLGARRVILKTGAQGAYVADENGFSYQPPFEVDAVDTTAAGDAFGAGFVVDYLERRNVSHALYTACAVGALTTTRAGAQTSLPYKTEVEVFVRTAGHPNAESR